MKAWWTVREVIRLDDGAPRFILDITHAPTVSHARLLLSADIGQAHELTSPGLVEEALSRPPGTVWTIGTRRAPSVYDQFHRGYAIDRRGRLRSMGYDHRAMEEAGFDVS